MTAFVCLNCSSVSGSPLTVTSIPEGLACTDCVTRCVRCDDVTIVNHAPTDEVHCYSCSVTYFRNCDWCGGTAHRDAVVRIGNGNTGLICLPCRDSAIRCGGCGGLEGRERVHRTGGFAYCYRCARGETMVCGGCGSRTFIRSLRDDLNGHPRCTACRRGYQPTPPRPSLHSHGHKPAPIFFPESRTRELFMGVELEVDEGNDIYSDAEVINTKYQKHVYLKKDGSLRNGFEIVTHPMTLDYHMNEFPWQELCEQVINLGYLSHNTDTCGLHVHMSRDAFTRLAAMKFLFMIERFWSQWVKFSRRTPYSLERWAASYGIKDTLSSLYSEALYARCKYKAVNLLNADTIEIRIFRGSLNHKTIKAALQLCSHLHYLSRKLSERAVMELTWEALVDSVTHDELAEYLNLMGLTNGSTELPVLDK